MRRTRAARHGTHVAKQQKGEVELVRLGPGYEAVSGLGFGSPERAPDSLVLCTDPCTHSSDLVSEIHAAAELRS